MSDSGSRYDDATDARLPTATFHVDDVYPVEDVAADLVLARSNERTRFLNRRRRRGDRNLKYRARREERKLNSRELHATGTSDKSRLSGKLQSPITS